MKYINQAALKQLIEKRNQAKKGSLVFFGKAYSAEELEQIKVEADASTSTYRFIIDLSD